MILEWFRKGGADTHRRQVEQQLTGGVEEAMRILFGPEMQQMVYSNASPEQILETIKSRVQLTPEAEQKIMRDIQAYLSFKRQ